MGCGRRFTTYEKIEELPVMVVKKDGRREPFDSAKIREGIRKACEKRPVSAAQQEELVEAVEREVFNSLEPEVSSSHIGELVMQNIKQVDEVAYVRFASVYRQFKDINTFMDELEALIKDKEKSIGTKAFYSGTMESRPFGSYVPRRSGDRDILAAAF
jgi:transcriptional repressor NrdR